MAEAKPRWTTRCDFCRRTALYSIQNCVAGQRFCATFGKVCIGSCDHYVEMTERMAKTAVVLLMGFLLGVQGMAPVGSTPVTASSATMSCCANGCSDCGSAVCCARPEGGRTPAVPVPSPWKGEPRCQAVAAPSNLSLAEPLVAADRSPRPARSSSRVGAIPIFERDCSFLI